jgi:hypothetical protein
VHYSHFLQKILNLFLPGPESLTVVGRKSRLAQP